jgi:hypothetical protein
MATIDKYSGFIGCARGNQGLYKYTFVKSEDQGSDTKPLQVTTEHIIKQGHFLDMLYFPSHKTLFLHEDREGRVLKLDQFNEVTPFFKQSCTNGLGGRQLKTTMKRDLLFILSDSNGITIFSEPCKKEKSLLVKVTDLPGEVITDFCPVFESQLATVSDEGILQLLKYSFNSFEG